MRRALSGWRLVLVSGALWGLAVVLAETTTLPMADLSVSDLALFGLQIMLPNVTAGLIWACGARLVEERGTWLLLTLAPTATAASMLVSIGFTAVEPRLMTGTGEFLRDLPVGDLAWYTAWTNLFYGYLYAVGYLAARRRTRGRAQLAVRRRERSEADIALREAQLASLRGQLQPDLLIEALHTLQQRFAHSQAEGDELFEIIIAFLRAAMPGVREQVSLLADELDTVRHYSKMCAALGRPVIRLGPIDRQARNVAFPSLLVLPLVHLLTSDAPNDRLPEVTTMADSEHYQIIIVAARADTPIAAALDALDAGVSAVGGNVAVVRGPAQIEIAISLPLPADQPIKARSLMSAR